MPYRPAEFDAAVAKLEPLMHDLPKRLVAIDGRMGAGKSTFGRFLSWYFNVTLVETDAFLRGDGTLSRRTDEIERIVSFRLEEKERPVLIEGVGMRELLLQLGRSADANVYVENRTNPFDVSSLVLEYEAKFRPKETADINVGLEHDG
jgi:hypothetical protein